MIDHVNFRSPLYDSDPDIFSASLASVESYKIVKIRDHEKPVVRSLSMSHYLSRIKKQVIIKHVNFRSPVNDSDPEPLSESH